MKSPRRRLRKRDLAGLPGEDLVLTGLKELREGHLTECALLVLIASPRLKALGLDIPDGPDIALPVEHRLFELLEAGRGAGAYSYYNSLLRTMSSFAHALEHRVADGRAVFPDEPDISTHSTQ
jgi:hypothetical protein